MQYSKRLQAWKGQVKAERTYSERPYQVKAAQALKSWLAREDSREGLVAMATGMGKTWTAADFVGKHMGGASVLWITHRDTLLEQSTRALEDAGREVDIIQGEKGYKGADTLVASVATLKGERLQQLKEAFEPQLIIFDEAHHGDARTWAEIKAAYPEARVLNLTATPYHGTVDNPKPLGEMLVCYSTRDAVEMGVAVEPLQVSLPLEPLRDLAMRGEDYDLDALARVMREQVHTCVEHTAPCMEGNVSLVFGTDLEHCEDLRAGYTRKGLKVEVISGEDSAEVKQDRLNRLRAGKLDALINYNVLLEGTDIPEVNQIVNLRPTRLSHLYVQMLGRGVRMLVDPQTQQNAVWGGHEVKQSCRIIDVPPLADSRQGLSFLPLPCRERVERERALGNVTEVGWEQMMAQSFVRRKDLEAYWEEGKVPSSKLAFEGAALHCNPLKGMAMARGHEDFSEMVKHLRSEGWEYVPQGLPISQLAWGYSLKEEELAWKREELLRQRKDKCEHPLWKEACALAQDPEGVKERCGGRTWQCGVVQVEVATANKSGAPSFISYDAENEAYYSVCEHRRGRSVILKEVRLDASEAKTLTKPLPNRGKTEMHLAETFKLPLQAVQELQLPVEALAWLANRTNPRFENAQSFALEMAQLRAQSRQKVAGMDR